MGGAILSSCDWAEEAGQVTFDNGLDELPDEVLLVVVSKRIRQIAADMGFKRIAVTNGPSDVAILETVTMCVTGGIEWPN